MARLMDWITGLEVVARAPLTGPRTVGSSTSEAIGGYVQTTATPFGLWRWQLTLRPMRHELFRRYRGLVTALHGGANAVRIPWCDPDLFWPETTVITNRTEVIAGTPWVVDDTIENTGGSVTSFGNMTLQQAAFNGITSQLWADSTRLASTTEAWLGLTQTRAIAGATIFPTSDLGLVSNQNLFTIELYGKTGAAPTTATDGSLLGSLGPIADTLAPQQILSNDRNTIFAHQWVRIFPATGSQGVRLAELQFAEPRPGVPWEDTGRNWRIGKPAVAVAAAAKGDDIVQLAAEAWGHQLIGGEWLGFVPFHFGLYVVTQIFPLEPGKIRIWPPLRKALVAGDHAVLTPTIAMRLENESGATAARGPVMADNAIMTLVEVEDSIVRDFFSD